MPHDALALRPHRYIEELVQAEIAAGVPSERVVVAGFSQGGAVALLMLRSDIKLGAVVGQSTWPLHPYCQMTVYTGMGVHRVPLCTTCLLFL